MAAESSNPRKTISLEEGWAFMQEGVEKLINRVEGVDKGSFTSEEYMSYYTTVYVLCSPGPLMQNHTQELRKRYKNVYEQHITQKVLPSLREKSDDGLLLLHELQRRWSNHKTIALWLMRFFNYLDQIPKYRPTPTLKQTGLLAFHDFVLGEMNARISNACLSLIDREREGEQIDRDLLKTVLAIYVEVGDYSVKNYVNDFEQAMLKDTAEFYSRKSSSWTASEAREDYMEKANACLKHERDDLKRTRNCNSFLR